MSQITTHVLNTALGKPAAGIRIEIQQLKENKQWESLGRGTTNADGRITDLLKKDTALNAGTYQLVFDTAGYFESLKLKCFYPFVNIAFEISGNEHYHVPLLLSPFGYSTYRGS